MKKTNPDTTLEAAPLVIGLGPGFIAKQNCHAVIETNRGPHLGRVLWDGSPEADTGIPETVRLHQHERVLYSPSGGQFQGIVQIGDAVVTGEMVAKVDGDPIIAPFPGVVRGLLHSGIRVDKGIKVGDLDPRGDKSLCFQVSDKALAVGGGVMEAILTQPSIRAQILWM